MALLAAYAENDLGLKPPILANTEAGKLFRQATDILRRDGFQLADMSVDKFGPLMESAMRTIRGDANLLGRVLEKVSGHQHR